MILTGGTGGNGSTVTGTGIPGLSATGLTTPSFLTATTIFIGLVTPGAPPAGTPITIISTIISGATGTTGLISRGIIRTTIPFSGPGDTERPRRGTAVPADLPPGYSPNRPETARVNR